jgi:hypothetical protein
VSGEEEEEKTTENAETRGKREEEACLSFLFRVFPRFPWFLLFF